MLIQLLRLRTKYTDKATKIQGTLVSWIMNMGQNVQYVFQPTGLDQDTGLPLERICLEEARLEVAEEQFEEVDVPVEILGTQVTDTATGFTGMAVGFVRGMNGCFHVLVQAPVTSGKDQNPLRRQEFDLRGCTGEKIPALTEDQLTESHKKNPSPEPLPMEEQISHTNLPPE